MIQTADLSASTLNEKFIFCSSLADDVWHPSNKSTAYEWWYFDAISDDGRDALVVIFLDNFIFSPRYNAFCDDKMRRKEGAEKTGQSPENVAANIAASQKYPAVAFCFYRDGKPIYRAINEFTPKEFSASTDFPQCQIGDNSFQFEATPYGVRYILNVNAVLRGKRRIHAALEWLAIERDFQKMRCSNDLTNAHFWNLVAPRADVTGKIEIFSGKDEQPNQIQFRGTGYHDHNFDSRWLPSAVGEWQWGRAHFADATAVFYRYHELGATTAITKLFTICENKLSVFDADYKFSNERRHFFGVKHPRTLTFSTAQNCALTIKQSKVIDASFFYLRFLSEMQLDLGDGRKRETVGITEYLQPNSLKWRRLDWLVNMRIGRNGRGAFLP